MLALHKNFYAHCSRLPVRYHAVSGTSKPARFFLNPEPSQVLLQTQPKENFSSRLTRVCNTPSLVTHSVFLSNWRRPKPYEWRRESRLVRTKHWSPPTRPQETDQILKGIGPQNIPVPNALWIFPNVHIRHQGINDWRGFSQAIHFPNCEFYRHLFHLL